MKYTIFPPNEKINFNKKLNIKFGIDPTADKLHLGHLIPLLLIKDFLEKGHHIDIVLGSYTAQLGDPSGKDTMRPILNAETTMENASKIMAQVIRVLGKENEKDLEFQMNHLWFQQMTAIEMTNILSKFTVSNLLARDSFSKRMEENNPIGMHELVVPILQGIDSVKLKTNVEIGGTDQLFNFNITREVQRNHQQEPEVCVLMPIINGTDGRKMSKSFNNCIFLDDTSENVFGKVMSISDDLMKEWWPAICKVNFPISDFKGVDFSGDLHPMKLKKDLAWWITKLICGHDKADKEFEHFQSVIQKKEIPKEIKDIKIPVAGMISILDIIMQTRNCSKTEARRLIEAKSVRFMEDGSNFKVIVSGDLQIVTPGVIIKVGKRNFAKIV